METLVVALGGNALLQRGECLSAENQYRNIATVAGALARLATRYRLAIVHGNGPRSDCCHYKIRRIRRCPPIRWIFWSQKHRA